MKTVYLIRHAKSDWNHPELSDFERPLNKRGKNDAPFMGKKLKELNIYPELIIASPAKRALETITSVSKEINYPIDKVIFDKSIYNSSAQNLIKLLNNVDNTYNTIFIIGHNPGLTYSSNYLTNDFIDNIVTCGIVKIVLEIESWDEIIEGIGRKVFYIYPKMYN